MSRKRILFVSENITLAQIVRLVKLADALDPHRFEIHFAANEFAPFIFGDRPWRRWPLYTVPAKQVFAALESGRRLYGRSTLNRYVSADLEVIDAVQPHLIVGDLRWSLTVSAPLRKVPHAALINAYWSREADRAGFPLPDHPIVKWLGEARAAEHFPKALPFVFKHFAAPLNSVRHKHGLPKLGNLLDVLMSADHVLFPDTPRLAPCKSLASNQRYLGPVLWAPHVALPEAWQQPGVRPRVYVTLGSSGRISLLPRVLKGLAACDVDVLLATAGRTDPENLPANITAVSYADGDQASHAANVVITNGGSTTGYQALAQGRPIIGIPSNFDQFLASQALDGTGAGITIPARHLTPDHLAMTVNRVLTEAPYREAAASLCHDMGQVSAADNFRRFIDETTLG